MSDSLESTFREEDTTAAIVVGYRLDFEPYSIPPEQVEALERGLHAALRARNLDLTHFVLGDTTTDPDTEVPAKFVLGLEVVSTAADDWEPSPVDPDAIARALAELPVLDEAFWKEALAGLEGVQIPSVPPAAYLLSWGPLCYAGLCVGVRMNRDGEATIKFIANQNMEQEWSDEGIDGVTVESAEYTDLVELAFSPDQLAKASALESPTYWLLCRYD